MKQFNINFLFFAVLLWSVSLLTTGCNKKLEVKNPNAVPVQDFWKSEADALSGVLGIYDAYQTTEMAGVRYTETDHVSDNGNTTNNNFGWFDIETSTHVSSNARILARWKAFYTIVNRANTAVANLTTMPSSAISDASRKRLIAEAMFLRDYIYLDLTTLWGNVPFYTEEVSPFDEGKGRTTKNEVRNALVEELKTSVIPNLPLNISAGERGRISADAARALLGKIYLYKEDWQNAATTLKEIIDGGRYALHPNYAELFTLAGEFSKENLWEINFETGGIDNGENFSIQIDTNLAPIRPRSFWKPTESYANSFLSVDGKPIAASPTYGMASPYYILANNSTGRFNNRDPRLKANLFTAADVLASVKPLWSFITTNPNTAFTANNNFAVKKYFMMTSTQYNGGPQNYYMIRYADVLLMFAEAQNELAGPDATVYDAVNAIRRRLKISEYLSGGNGALSGTATATPTAEGMSFDLSASIVLKRVNISLAANLSGSVMVSLQNSAGTTLNSTTINIAAATGTAQRVVTLPLFFTINAGTGYRLLLTSTLPVAREATATYPFNLFGAGNITGTLPATTAGYNYLYNWQYDLLNSTVRMPDYPAGLSQAAMRQYIRDERRWEFGFEHSRYYDLLRWRIADVVLNNVTGTTKKFTSPRDYLWPYPQEEMDNNAAMRAGGQNPDW